MLLVKIAAFILTLSKQIMPFDNKKGAAIAAPLIPINSNIN